MRVVTVVLVAAGLAGSARAAECPRPLSALRPDLAVLLETPPAALRPPRPAPIPVGAVVNDDGVRLPLAEGGAAILANDWSRCSRGTSGCEPALRQEIVDSYPDLGVTLVAGWLPGREAALYRLVDDRSGAVTAIGGRPNPSPSHHLAAVVAGDSRSAWAGTEIWRFGGPVPQVEWEQDAPAPADYAFAGWRGEDLVLLAANRLDPAQNAPVAAALVCADNGWHLIHATVAPWLARLASPSGRRHALLRSGAVVVWQDGEQAFSAPAVASGLIGWSDEDNVLFSTPAGGQLRVRADGGGWRLE